MAPRIAGIVAAVLVGDNQPVKAGDVIARLDDRSYRVQLKQAEAEVDKDRAQILGVAAAIVQQQAQVASSRADLANAEAALTFSPAGIHPLPEPAADRLGHGRSASSRRMPTCASATPPATRPPPRSMPRRSRSTA